MRLNNEKIESINRNYRSKYDGDTITLLSIDNSPKGISIFKGHFEVCTLEYLDKLIYELQLMKKSIEEETGIEF